MGPVSIETVKQNPLTAIITGASGFVGSHLTKKLIREGWDVHVIVRAASNLRLLDSVLNRIKTHYYSGGHVRFNKDMENVRPDIVFHLLVSSLKRWQVNRYPLCGAASIKDRRRICLPGAPVRYCLDGAQKPDIPMESGGFSLKKRKEMRFEENQ